MSWDLVDALRKRFPDVQPFPRGETHPAAEYQPVAPSPAAEAPAADVPEPEAPAVEASEGQAQPAAAAPARPAGRAHVDPKAYAFHVPGATVPAERLLEICRVVRDEAPFHLDYCSFVSAIDYPADSAIDVLYHLFSMTVRHELLLRVRVSRDAPRVPSVTGIWRGADWHERETFDLLGVVFDGHPDLRRIMMT
ncbi:MAG TPA: NADH-quinone oxidoreductase subunit C, partial [bacterium]|nr:NADH-quinone oxidoreductase subunit C [bacterium]